MVGQARLHPGRAGRVELPCSTAPPPGPSVRGGRVARLEAWFTHLALSALVWTAALVATLHAEPSDKNHPYLWLEDVQGEHALS